MVFGLYLLVVHFLLSKLSTKLNKPKQNPLWQVTPLFHQLGGPCGFDPSFLILVDHVLDMLTGQMVESLYLRFEGKCLFGNFV